MLPVLAMPLPVVLPIFLVGLGLALITLTAFLGLTRRRGNERNRRAGLGLVAIIVGPLVGLSWALLIEVSGDISPVDVVYQRTVIGVIGGFVGFGVGVFCAVSAALARNDPKPAKSNADGLD